MTPFSYMSVDEIHFLERTKAMVKERGETQNVAILRWPVLTCGAPE